MADEPGGGVGETVRPAHHGANGKFRIPWPMEAGDDSRGMGDMLRWQWERMRHRPPPNPPPGALPMAQPRVAVPRAPAGEARITWVGHATFLVQAGGLNLLTDPVWSRRASPSQRVGPARLVPPGIDFDALPPIDAVLLSHDHYDHLDAPTVRRLRARFGDAVPWITPLGYRAWFAGAEVRRVTELDWWDETEITGEAGSARVVCAPAQHWTRRRLREFNDRLWASYALFFPDGTRIYFGGDSGWFAGYDELGRRLGPFDATMMPIGAYEPRWFMRPAHMNPEEAVRAHGQLGGRGKLVAMHWGTFRLTDEDPLEPPVRARAAWAEAGYDARDLAILRHGETLVLGG